MRVRAPARRPPSKMLGPGHKARPPSTGRSSLPPPLSDCPRTVERLRCESASGFLSRLIRNGWGRVVARTHAAVGRCSDRRRRGGTSRVERQRPAIGMRCNPLKPFLAASASTSPMRSSVMCPFTSSPPSI